MSRRVLFVVTEDWYFYSHRLACARHLVAQGYEVAVACKTAMHQRDIEKAGIRVLNLSWSRGGGSVMSTLRALWQLFKIYRVYQPDIIHLVALKPILLGGPLALLFENATIINAVSGLGVTWSSTGWRHRIRRAMITTYFKRTSRFKRAVYVVQNQDDLNLLHSLGIPTDKTRLIPGVGVDTDVFQPREARSGPRLRVVLVGRLLIDKGVREFVEAAKRVRAENNAVDFALIGWPDMGNANPISSEVLTKWVDAGVVEWRGYEEDVASTLDSADIMVLPSYREGLPKVLLEAAAAGLPLVATDVPGCREVVQDGVNGLLVPAKDADALAKAILTLVNDVQLRARMGQAARETALSRFSSTIIHRAFDNLYQDIQTKG